MKSDIPERSINVLVTELRQMIDEARASVAVAVNYCLTFIYWRVGKRINLEALRESRAECGKKDSCHGVATFEWLLWFGLQLFRFDTNGAAKCDTFLEAHWGNQMIERSQMFYKSDQKLSPLMRELPQNAEGGLRNMKCLILNAE